jgi:hypothetical protein
MDFAFFSQDWLGNKKEVFIVKGIDFASSLKDCNCRRA